MKNKYNFLGFSVLLVFLFSGFLTVRVPSGVFRGVIAQEGENDPYAAYSFENTLGVSFSFVRSDAGQYFMEASGNIFPSSAKVYMNQALYNEGMDNTNMCLIKTRRWDGNTLLISAFRYDGESLAWVPSDDCSFFFEIVVYP